MKSHDTIIPTAMIVVFIVVPGVWATETAVNLATTAPSGWTTYGPLVASGLGAVVFGETFAARNAARYSFAAVAVAAGAVVIVVTVVLVATGLGIVGDGASSVSVIAAAFVLLVVSTLTARRVRQPRQQATPGRNRTEAKDTEPPRSRS